MKSTLLTISCFVFFLFTSFQVFAQNTVVKGKILDVNTGEAVPFATVVFTGTQDGTISDINGSFHVKTSKPVDSIEVSFVGYTKVVKPLVRGKKQEINFELQEDVQILQDVVVTPGENPAFAIMRKVKKNKIKNDQRVLKAYNYEKYAKVELALKNAQKKLEGREGLTAMMKRLDSLAANDTLSGLKWDKGKTILPYYISETMSDYYYRKDPVLTHEKVKKTQSKGIKLSNGSVVSKVVSSAFQDYNFYQNWITIFKKEFISPIADSWRVSYKYDLLDSLYLGDDFCYHIAYEPVNDQNLAFTGDMYISKADYALKKIKATVPPTANINFIERIKIDQEMTRTRIGVWLPKKVKVSVDVDRFSEKGVGVLAKYNCSMKEHQTNNPRGQKFYLNPYVIDQNAEESTEEYWEKNRHETMSSTEQEVYNMVDTIKSVPNVSFYENLLNVIIFRYIPGKKIDIGPYITFLGLNNVEGLRLGLSGRTNSNFSKKFRVGGFLGYGFKDKKFKYTAYSDIILNRDVWTNLHIESSSDVEPIWMLTERFAMTSYFYGFAHLGKMRKPFYTEKFRMHLERQMAPGLTQKLEFNRESLNPNFDFKFKTGEKTASGTPVEMSKFQISEVNLTTRYAKDEMLVIRNNERINLAPTGFIGKWPILELTYSYGMKGVWGSDLEYHRLKLSVIKRQKMGLLGLSWFKLIAGATIGDMPYPLLFNPVGNETPLYTKRSYNMMKYFEFSSDRHISLLWRHSFEGILMNKIPLLRKMKLRFIVNANMVYGMMSDRNKALNASIDKNGKPLFYTLEKKPYFEIGYGVSNIFKLFMFQVFQRLNYLEDPTTSRFGIKFNVKVDF